jgi:hypothetical protein
MIINLQCIVFFLFGFLCWNGVDDAIKTARRDAENAILISLPLEVLTQMKVSDV